MTGFIYLPLLSFILSFILIRLLIKKQSLISIQDFPKDRSLHAYPIPRTGGLGIIFGFFPVTLLASFFYSIKLPLLVIVGFFIVFVISLIDDIKDLSPSIKLLFQIIAIAILIYNYFAFISYNYLVIFSIFFLSLWFLNLYNFMDGLDGLCGFMSLIGFLFFSILFYNKNIHLSLFSLIYLGSVLAFLIFNFPPAKIFLGDAGSISLGYIFLFLSLESILKNNTGLINIILLFFIFIYDATTTLLRRIFRGKKPWEAHREHLYQRLATSPFGKKKTLYLYMSLISLSFILSMLPNKNFDFMPFTTLFFLFFVLLIIEFYASKLCKKNY